MVRDENGENPTHRERILIEKRFEDSRSRPKRSFTPVALVNFYEHFSKPKLYFYTRYMYSLAVNYLCSFFSA